MDYTDLLKALFTVILYLDVPLAVASFLFAYILLRQSKGNTIYFNFGMSILFLSFWSATILLLFFRILPLSSIFLENISFLFGLLLLHYFLIFTFKFPIPRPQDKFKILVIYCATLLVSFSTFIPGLYVTSSKVTFPFVYINFNIWGPSIFTLYFFLLIFLSFNNLIKKYLNSGSVFKGNLKKIIIGTAITALANLLFSVLAYYLTGFDASIIGVFFIFGVLVYIYIILFR